MDLTSIFDRIIASNTVIASQQRNEPDLTHHEKHEILQQLYATKPATFVYRFGSMLSDDELKQNFDSNADYIQQIVKTNRHKIRANRRYAYMQQLISSGRYFSEEAMKERSPLLYEQLIGKYSDGINNPLVTKTASGPLTDFYMEHLESIGHQERVIKEYENERKSKDDDRNSDEDDGDDDDDDDDDQSLEDEQNQKIYTDAERNLYREEFLAIHKEKFLNGEDSNIDYVSIDNNESLDDFKIRENDEEEKYFDEDDSNSSNGKNADEKSY